jgi:hypothetical protein
MSTVISAFERTSKGFYLALNSSRMLKTQFFQKTAVKSQKKEWNRGGHLQLIGFQEESIKF